MASPVGIGVIGAGTISDTYLENLTKFADTEVLAIGDIVTDAAQEKAAKYDVPAAGDVATVLERPGCGDRGQPHHSGGPRRGGESGDRGRQTRLEREAARPRSRQRPDACSTTLKRLGCWLAVRPDTFLGPGLQTACRLIEQGMIGTPLTASGAAAVAWAGVVASESGVPVCGGRRPTFRSWALLPHGARSGLRASLLGGCSWFEGPGTAGDRLRAEGGRGI